VWKKERKTCGEVREILITIFIIIIMAQRKKRESTLLTFFLSFPETKLLSLIINITSVSIHPNHHHLSHQSSFEGGRGEDNFDDQIMDITIHQQLLLFSVLIFDKKKLLCT
jgi:hypothetical protein